MGGRFRPFLIGLYLFGEKGANEMISQDDSKDVSKKVPDDGAMFLKGSGVPHGPELGGPHMQDKTSGKGDPMPDKNTDPTYPRVGLSFGVALEAVKKGKGMRLPEWSGEVVIRA